MEEIKGSNLENLKKRTKSASIFYEKNMRVNGTQDPILICTENNKMDIALKVEWLQGRLKKYIYTEFAYAL